MKETDAETDMDFDQQSMASKQNSKNEEHFADIRASTIMKSRRPTSQKTLSSISINDCN